MTTEQNNSNWRNLSDAKREAFLQEIYNLLDSRFGTDSIGRLQYGDEFQGDPLEHLIEELADALFYAIMAKMQRSAARMKVNDVLAATEPIIEQLERFSAALDVKPPMLPKSWRELENER